MKTSRTLIPVILGAIVTIGLFYLMVSLIFFDTDEIVITEPPPGIHFSEVEPPKDAETKPPRPEEPPPPKEPPPPPDLTITTERPEPPIEDLNILTPPTLGPGILVPPQQPDGKGNPAAEGEAIPIVRIRPVYPPDAIRERIEGWVTIQFTITPLGTVKGPRVTDSKPRRVFDQAAIRSILKWKFKPKVVNGKAIESSAIQTLEFKLEN